MIGFHRNFSPANNRQQRPAHFNKAFNSPLNRNNNVVMNRGTVFTGAGNDHVAVRPNAGNTNIYTGTGNDHVFLGPNAGNSNIHTGAGNDVINIVMTDQQGDINIDGGAGYDTVNITDLSTTDTEWSVDYNAEENDSNFTINVGDSSYVVGTDVESFNLFGANNESILSIDNITNWLNGLA